MTRLIDADEFKSVFTKKSTEAVCGAELCKAIISRIDDQPTVDAVPVIRCKDCKHSETDRNGITYCTKFWRFMEYCSSGKRKEE